MSTKTFVSDMLDDHRVTQRVQLRTKSGNMVERIVGCVGQNLVQKTRRCGDTGWPERRVVVIKSARTLLESDIELVHPIRRFRIKLWPSQKNTVDQIRFKVARQLSFLQPLPRYLV